MSSKLHLKITGLVQGVNYRAWAKQRAESMGITGWIRNLQDGSVEAVLTGDREFLNDMVELLYAGPNGAKVEKVEIVSHEPDVPFHDNFQIVR